jgi:hypothetical protein
LGEESKGSRGVAEGAGLEEMEGFIRIFREAVPWDFIDYDKLFPEDP